MTIQRKRIMGTILTFLVLVLLFPAVYVNAASQGQSICNVSYEHVLPKSSLSVTVTGDMGSGSLIDGEKIIIPGNGTVEYKDLTVGTVKTFEVKPGTGYKLVSLSYSKPETDANTYYDILDQYVNEKISITVEDTPTHLVAEFQKEYVPNTMDPEDYPPFEVVVDGSGILIADYDNKQIKEGDPGYYELAPQTVMWFEIQSEAGKELVSLKYQKVGDTRAVDNRVIDITNRVDSTNRFWLETCYEKIILVAEFKDADGEITPPGGGGTDTPDTPGGDGTGGSGSGGAGSSGGGGSSSSGGSGSSDSSSSSSSGSGDTNVNVNTNVNVSGTGSDSTSGSGSTGSTAGSKTGDNAATGWYLILMLIATAAIIIVAKKKKGNVVYKESE